MERERIRGLEEEERIKGEGEKCGQKCTNGKIDG